MKRILVVLLGVIVFASGVVLAHDGEDHMKHNKLMGTVTSVDAEKGRLEIKMKDGKSETITCDKSTKVMMGDKPAAMGDVKVGARAVVTTMDHSGTKMAMEVRLPATKMEPAPAK